jgi:hypothetical protein
MAISPSPYLAIRITKYIIGQNIPQSLDLVNLNIAYLTLNLKQGSNSSSVRTDMKLELYIAV